MVHIERVIEIKAPVEKVWEFISDVERTPEWAGDHVQKVKVTSGKRRGVGRTTHEIGVAFGKRYEKDFVVTEWVRREKIAFKSTSGWPWKGSYTLQSFADGTLFKYSVDFELPFAVSKMREVFRKKYEELFDEWVQNIKCISELMALEENKAIIRKLIEAVNTQNLALLDELMASDCIYHRNAQQIRGLQALKEVVESKSKGFPDLHVTIEDIMAEEKKVCVRLKETFTHSGEYRGLAPTGKKIEETAVAIFRIIEGKIIEGWAVYDQLDLLTQLGVVEYKGFPDEIK